MATIIDLGDGRFIAGDPVTDLPLGHHWCLWCAGDGLEYDHEGELSPCWPCYGSGIVACVDTACPIHSSLHPADDDAAVQSLLEVGA